MRADIADGKFEGWNDPRLPTISALKRRGFDPQAIRDFWLDLGLTQKDISISMQTIESFNSSVIDAVCERRSFVRNPRALSFNMIGSELPEKLQIARHPHDEIEGFREWKISDKFVIEDTDYSEQLRLKDFADISINHNDALVDSLERSDKRPIVHWLPINQSRMARLTSPSGSGFRVEEGLIENFELVEGTIVQLERVGFARIEKIPENGPVDLLYLHG